MPLRAPELTINPLMVFVVVAAVMAPAVLTVKFDEVTAKLLAPTFKVLAAPPLRFNAPALETVSVPEVVVDRLRAPVATVTLRPPVDGPVSVRAAVPLKTTLPAYVNNPLPVVIGPLVVVCSDKVLLPISQVLAAAPVRFKAAALFRDKAPEVVVDSASGPAATVIVRPPVPGPVMVRAVVPLKVKLPPNVVKPPFTVKVLVPVTLVAPLRLLMPVVVPKLPEPLKVMAGFEVVLPRFMPVPLVPAPMLIAAAPPASRLRALAPLDWIDKVPATVGLIVLPMVMSAAVTVRVRLVVPPATVNPSAALASVRPFMVVVVVKEVIPKVPEIVELPVTARPPDWTVSWLAAVIAPADVTLSSSVPLF